jgi:dipeptidyl aminopeptidase/acylaminoacyl peptidase
MKSKYLLILMLLSTSLVSQQNKLLLNEKIITDFSNTPIFERLTNKVDGKISWKKEFQYLDSIQISWISYLSEGLKVKGLLVRPKKEGLYPAVIFNRGGNREFGSLKVAHGVYTLGRLAKEGYVVIASNYRGNGGGDGIEEFGGAEVADVINLIDVLKEVKGADSEKIGMYGWSRGGMMTYITLTKTDRIKAAVVGGAVSDNFESIKDRPEMETHVLSELIPNYKENKEEELTKRSAIKWADKFPKNVPLLMLHGNSDWRVKAEQSLTLALELEKYRVPYRLVIFEGGDHGISEFRSEVDEIVVNWFDKYLKKDAPLPNMEYHGR